jgi:hypothetical protein
LSSGGTQQFTATVTGTANTAVTWSATAGSVDSSGFYTAPVVQKITNATVTATSQADPTKSATSTVTVNPGQGQSLQITTSALPQGQRACPDRTCPRFEVRNSIPARSDHGGQRDCAPRQEWQDARMHCPRFV